MKRTIEKNLVFPLANLLATAQLRYGDHVRIDLDSERHLTFTKEVGRITRISELCEVASSLRAIGAGATTSVGF